jgi:chromosomal replication initiation ATPase DnaA
MGALLKQMVMPFAPATSYQPDDFIAGSANAAALSLVERWPDWPYSLVVVHGPAGCGKTHLAHRFAARHRASFLPVERIGKVPADMLLAGNHGWVIDGLEGVRDEVALAQLINHARARGDYILMTARSAPSQLAIQLNDLRSRITALPEVALGAPDEALLEGVLAKEFADRQLRVAPEVIRYSVRRLERSFEAVQRFADSVDTASLASGRAVTLNLARQLL